MARSAPSVLDPDETWHLPQQVYVAARPDRASGGPMLEVREFGKHAQRVILAYSSLDAFLASCGADQPWVLVPAERLPEFARSDETDSFAFSVVVDRTVPGEARGTAGGMAQAQASWDDEESEDWDVVYVLSRQFRRGDPQAQLELQPMPGEHLAIMAYSSQTSLEFGCGAQQPWVSVPAGLLSEVRRQSGADTICLDTPLPEHLRHGSENKGG